MYSHYVPDMQLDPPDDEYEGLTELEVYTMMED